MQYPQEKESKSTAFEDQRSSQCRIESIQLCSMERTGGGGGGGGGVGWAR